MTVRRLMVRLVVLAFVASACSKSTEAPIPTSIVVTPATLSFGSLVSTRQLAAKVLDQNGDSMPGQSVTWSTSSSAVVIVSAQGQATSQGNGTATITAHSGSLTKDVPVTVAQVPSFMTKTGGDGQISTVGSTLPTVLKVHVTDGGGAPVQNVNVAFAVTAGGGSVSAASAATNGTGDATVSWTLGTVAGAAQQATATLGALAPIQFTATANAGPVTAASPQAGDNQTRAINLAVLIAPSVKVTDTYGNPKPNQAVVFSVTAGGGSVTGATTTTDAGGIATVGSWTMGPSAGTNTLHAAVSGTAVTYDFTATAVTVGAPTDMAILVGNNQTGLIGYATNVRPAVVVTDAGGQPVSGVSVTFAVQGGGGGLTNATVSTNALGIAQVGSWTLGASAGANSLSATAAPGGITGNPLTFSATGAAPAFNITLVNRGPAFKAPVQAAFDSAIAFWQRVIYTDLPDVPNFSTTSSQCILGYGPVNVDDVLILASVDSIDGPGPGTILGGALVCTNGVRPGTHLVIAGAMIFDSSDVDTLIAKGSLNAVIRHEMGHVLGIGTKWDAADVACIHNLSSPPSTILDTYFDCPNAVAAFDSIGGTSYTGGQKVPVENCGPASPSGCGQGTVNAHWREPTFGDELMTGYIRLGVPNPASLLTVATLLDHGYTVNLAAAEPYTRVFTVPSSVPAGSLLYLGNDVLRLPLPPDSKLRRLMDGQP